jgi:biotin transport system substrate-specific component
LTTAALPASRPLVLADLVSRTRVHDIALVTGGALFTALLAQIAIPVAGSPVPITGQTLAVVLAGAALGPGRGLASQFLYLMLIAVGLPVYAQAWTDPTGSSGIDRILGATGGYLIGFLIAGYLVGLAARYGYDRQPWKALPLFAAGQLAIFAIGVPWLAAVANLDAATAIDKGLTPFVVGGIVKAAIAAALLPGAWWIARQVQRED